MAAMEDDGDGPDREDAKEDLIQDAKDAFQLCVDHEAKNRVDALDDIRFARLEDQWPDRVRKDRERDGRPCLTLSKLAPMIRQVVNDARQNKPAIAVHPADDDADPETAEIFTGLIRNIEQSSDAEIAYDTALDSACTNGWGYFLVNLRYCDDETFDQDICIEAIANPLSVYGDPLSSKFDSSDWDVAFVLDRLTEKSFKKKYKGKDATSFTEVAEVKGETKTGGVVLAHWWTREPVERQIVLIGEPDLTKPQDAQTAAAKLLAAEGGTQIIDLDVYNANKAMFAAAGMSIVGKPRTVEGKKVVQRILSGSDVLETIEWPGKFIPIVPVYGEVVNFEGVRYFRSLIRGAKDAQRMFNYWRTVSTEVVALAPKAPFIGEEGAFDVEPEKWETANTENHAYLQYAKGKSPPQRQPFAGVPAGAIQEALNAADDIKSIIGLYDASLGARSNETSGKAIMARQREGDVSTFHYIDNLSRAIRHAGRILIDLIPKVYSVPRVLRILGPEGDPKLVPVNQKFMAPTDGKPGQQSQSTPAGVQEQGDDNQIAEIEKIYDLTVGKYDLTVTAGPSFTSRREEAATQMMALIQAFPPAAPVIGDLLAKNLDWPGADEIAERLKALIPQGADDPNAPNPQMEQAKTIIGQLQQTLQKVEAEGKGAISQLQDKLKAALDDHEIAMRKLEIDQFNAETNRLKAVAPQGAMPTAQELAPILAESLQMIGMGQITPQGGAAAMPPEQGPGQPEEAEPMPDADNLPPSAAEAAEAEPPEATEETDLPPSAAEAA